MMAVVDHAVREFYAAVIYHRRHGGLIINASARFSNGDRKRVAKNKLVRVSHLHEPRVFLLNFCQFS